MYATTIVEGELRWQEHPDPVPADTELLVAVRAAGINAADLLQLRGNYPAPAGAPADIPGLELAGEVVAVGRRVRGFTSGDRVMALVGGGAQAELAVVEAATAMIVPDSVSFEAAGAFPEVFTTAHDALFTQGGLQLGDRVLVTGAAGGVGTAAVQLAACGGARVVASVRSEALRPALLELGAEFALAPEKALERGPFDLALELVGGQSVPAVLEALAIGGRISVIGIGAGRTAELNLGSLMGRRAGIFGSTLRARSVTEKATVAHLVEQRVVPLLASGRVRVPVAARYPMDSAADGYAHHRAGGKLGKVVLVPRPTTD